MHAPKPYLILLALLVVEATGQAQSPLRWQAKAGMAYDIERVVSLKQTVELQGKATTEERRSTWQIRLDAREQRGDDLVFDAKLTHVEHKIIGINKADLLDKQIHEKMKDATFKFTITPTGKIVELAGYEAFLNRVSEGKKDKIAAARQAFPESALVDAFTDVFGPLPDEAVKPGDAWQRTQIEPIPHFGSLRRTVKSTLVAVTGDQARIEYSIATAFALPKNESEVVFKITKGNVESEKSAGTLVFDRVLGHVVTNVRTLRLRGSVTVEAGPRRQTVTFTSESEVAISIKASKK